MFHPFDDDLPRLAYVHTRDHAYTFKEVQTDLNSAGISARRMPIEYIWKQDAIPAATYILTDFDRMNPTEVEVLGHIHDRLTEAGCTVLNDPRRFRPRAALLKHLYRQGLNNFDCWLPAHGERPDRFPVFLRSIAGHRGVISDLLTDANAADQAVEAACETGFALADLVLIEHVDTWAPDVGAYQKHAAFCIGGHILRANSVNDQTWVAKYGAPNAATPEYYAQERAEMTDYPQAGHMARVAQEAGVAWGRIDFGIVDGAPQVFEVNTNPAIGFSNDHPDANRRETMALMRQGLVAALGALARPNKGMIEISDIQPQSQSRNNMPRRF